MTGKSELSIRFCFFPLLFVLFPLQMTSGAEGDLPDMDDVVWMTQSELTVRRLWSRWRDQRRRLCE